MNENRAEEVGIIHLFGSVFNPLIAALLKSICSGTICGYFWEIRFLYL
jgi:hypothetical protein